MDSDALRTFVTVYRCGGFSAAAERLNRSQPAISRRITLLEDELGVPVFERTGGGIALSLAGQALLPHAERVLAALSDADDAVRALKSTHAGPLSVAIVGTLASTDLTTTLKRFVARCPGVRLSLQTATSAQVSDLVRGGKATIGLRYADDPAPDLRCLPLAPEDRVICCSTDHPLAGKTVATLRDLQTEHWLGFAHVDARGEITAGTIFAQFLARGIAEIDWTAVDSLTAQKRLVEAGFGIALLPVSSVAEELRGKTLRLIAVRDMALQSPVTAIVRRDGYLSPAAQALLQVLQAAKPAGKRRTD